MMVKGFSNEIVKPPLTSDNGLSLRLALINNAKIGAGFEGSCIKQK